MYANDNPIMSADYNGRFATPTFRQAVCHGAKAIVSGIKVGVNAISTAVEAFNNVYENIPAPAKAVFIVAATTVAIALEDLMPHVHDKTVPGKVRAPYPDEIP